MPSHPIAPKHAHIIAQHGQTRVDNYFWLFVSARVSSLALLPQGKVEAARRVKAMVAKMDELGFGACTNTRACEMECPKNISVTHIARMNREFLKAKIKD